VYFDDKLQFKEHMHEKRNKAYMICAIYIILIE